MVWTGQVEIPVFHGTIVYASDYLLTIIIDDLPQLHANRLMWSGEPHTYQ